MTQPETVREIGIEYFAVNFGFFDHNLVQVSSLAIHCRKTKCYVSYYYQIFFSLKNIFITYHLTLMPLSVLSAQ